MILGDLININPALDRLMNKRFKNFQVVRELAALSKAIQEEIKFYTTQETELVKTYAAYDDKGQIIFTGPNTIKLKDPADKAEFEKQLEALRFVDVSDRIKVVKISEDDFKTADDLITPADLVLLSSVIEFV